MLGVGSVRETFDLGGTRPPVASIDLQWAEVWQNPTLNIMRMLVESLCARTIIVCWTYTKPHIWGCKDTLASTIYP